MKKKKVSRAIKHKHTTLFQEVSGTEIAVIWEDNLCACPAQS